MADIEVKAIIKKLFSSVYTIKNYRLQFVTNETYSRFSFHDRSVQQYSSHNQ